MGLLDLGVLVMEHLDLLGINLILEDPNGINLIMGDPNGINLTMEDPNGIKHKPMAEIIRFKMAKVDHGKHLFLP
jgi:hypothetical protein